MKKSKFDKLDAMILVVSLILVALLVLSINAGVIMIQIEAYGVGILMLLFSALMAACTYIWFRWIARK